MEWLHVKNPEDEKASRYGIFSYGSLWNFYDSNEQSHFKNVSLNADEIKELLKLNGMERYRKCKELFKSKYPQSEKQKQHLPEEKQSELEKLFPEEI